MKAPKFPVRVTTARARVTKTKAKAKAVRISSKAEIVSVYKVSASNAKMHAEAVRTAVKERPISLLSAGIGGNYGLDCVGARLVAAKLSRRDVEDVFLNALRQMIASGTESTPSALRLKEAYGAVRAGKTVLIG